MKKSKDSKSEVWCNGFANQSDGGLHAELTDVSDAKADPSITVQATKVSSVIELPDGRHLQGRVPTATGFTERPEHELPSMYVQTTIDASLGRHSWIGNGETSVTAKIKDSYQSFNGAREFQDNFDVEYSISGFERDGDPLELVKVVAARRSPRKTGVSETEREESHQASMTTLSQISCLPSPEPSAKESSRQAPFSL